MGGFLTIPTAEELVFGTEDIPELFTPKEKTDNTYNCKFCYGTVCIITVFMDLEGIVYN